MTNEPNRPDDFTAETEVVSENAVAMARRQSESTKRLTRKLTESRIEALRALRDEDTLATAN